MLKFSLFPAIAAVLCAALLFSCSSNSPTDDPSSSSVVPSSNSTGGSSSSVNVSNNSSSSYSSSSNSTNGSSSSEAVSDPDLLIKKTITLSNAGNNYADIDGNITTYKQAGVTGSILGKIDMIAYCGTDKWCPSPSIYTPWEIGLFFSTDDYFLGSDNVWFFEIPSAQAGIFKTAEKLSEIETTLNNLRNTLIENECEYCVDEIPIAKDKVFLVQTSEEKIRIVIIKETGNQSVDLEIIQID